jgi:hypothetical protein
MDTSQIGWRNPVKLKDRIYLARRRLGQSAWGVLDLIEVEDREGKGNGMFQMPFSERRWVLRHVARITL